MTNNLLDLYLNGKLEYQNSSHIAYIIYILEQKIRILTQLYISYRCLVHQMLNNLYLNGKLEYKTYTRSKHRISRRRKMDLQMYLSAVCQYGFWMLSPMENEYHFIKIQLIIKFNVKEKETVKKGVYKHGKNDNTYKGCNQ